MPSSSLDRIRRNAETVLRSIPRQIEDMGRKQDAAYMRVYLTARDNKALFKKLCFPMVLRIGCTEENLRLTEQQCEALSLAVLEDTIEVLTQEGDPESTVLRKELAADPRPLHSFARDLVRACRNWRVDASG
jgi:hypothetical protein